MLPGVYAKIALTILVYLVMAPGHAAETVDDRFSGLARRLEQLRTELEIPAISWVISGPDKILHQGALGYADVINKKKVTDQTLFRAGSVTKTITALAVLKAAEMKLLALDDKARSHVPVFPVRNRWHRTHPIRLIHLLEHTAGLMEMSPEEFNVQQPMDLQSALWWKAEKRETRWPPGQHHSYNNVGAGLSALLLQTCSGMTYEEFVSRHLFLPLAMTSASFYPGDEVMRDLAHGYDSDGRTRIPYWHVLYRSFAGLNVHTTDMAAVVQLLLNRGTYRGHRILDPGSIERMEKPSSTLAAAAGLDYGYGAGLYAFQSNGHLFYGHGGDADGYLSRLAYNRAAETGYYVVINVFRDEDLYQVRALIEGAITRDLPTPAVPVPAAVPGTVLRAYTGPYVAATSRFELLPEKPGDRRRIHLSLEGNQLYITKNTRKRALYPVSGTQFRYRGETRATAAFGRDGDGTVYFQDSTGNYQRLP